jgi:hypothetical protein
MLLLATAFQITLFIQLFHSAEELSTGFHKRWYLFKMPFWVFLAFETCFNSLWIAVQLLDGFPYRAWFMTAFLFSMHFPGL